MAPVSPALTEAENRSLGQLLNQKRWKPARALLERFIHQHPDDPSLYDIMACLLVGSSFREYHAAELCLRRGLDLDPTSCNMRKNLGVSLLYQARFDEARPLFDALLAEGFNAEVMSWRMLLSRADPRETADSTQDSIQWAGAMLRQYLGSYPVTLPPVDRQPRRLRIGYYGYEFYDMQMFYFLYPLLQHHDRNRFELYAYTLNPYQDSITKKYSDCFGNRWTDLSTLSRERRTARIAADNLDILVAASGNNFGEDYAVFLDHPARIQVGWWISSGATSTLDCFDWLLVDPVSAPPGSDALFSEKLWRIDNPATSFLPGNWMGDVSPLPALQNGFVTFCSLTRLFRLNPEVVRVWSQILHRVPNAHFLIDSPELGDLNSRKILQQQFVHHGISPERLDFRRDNPWRSLRASDITLDAFPFSAGTSPCQAMYMGHPVITRAGLPSHGRLAAAHVTAAGHPEWITQSEEDYINLAVDLAENIEKLAIIRQSLRAELEASPLMDYQGFARKIGDAYCAMWEQKYAL